MPAWDDDKLKASVKCNISVSGVLRDFGLSTGPGNFRSFHSAVRRLGLDTSHFLGRSHGTSVVPKAKPVDYYLVDGSNIASSSLRRKLLRHKLIEEKCAECDLGPVWNGKPITLQLDHVNGDSFDNRLENLRLLCPNCHTQTDNFGSKKDREGNHRSRYIPKKMMYFCVDCNSEINRQARQCRDCSNRAKVQKDWPSVDVLLDRLKTEPYTKVAATYGATDNALRKYLYKNIGYYPKFGRGPKKRSGVA